MLSLTKKLKHTTFWDIQWIKESRIPLGERIGYIFRKYYSLITRATQIKYLGTTYQSDNITNPVTLQSYPSEIFNVSKYVDFSQRSSILDIGANTGQFCTTLAKLFPNSHVYSFEANPDIFELLELNTKSITNSSVFNSAVGPSVKMPFYYVPGKSAKGSFIKANAIINLQNQNPTEVVIESIELSEQMCSTLGIPAKYDLIKIDVEGFECQVLDALKGIKAKYLFIEYSVGRGAQSEFFDLLKKAEKIFGKLRVVLCDEIKDKSTMGNVLVKCINE